MATRKILSLDEVSSAILPCLQKSNVLKAIVFGSYARKNESSRSDLDLILVMRTTKPFFERYEGVLSRLYEAVRGVDIDVLIYTPEELEFMRDRKFIQTIIKEGVCIYESGQTAV